MTSASDGISTVLLTVAYDSGMDERVMETLAERGVAGWTKTFDAHGVGGAGRQTQLARFPWKRHSALAAGAGGGDAADRRRPARPAAHLSPQPRPDDVDDARAAALIGSVPAGGRQLPRPKACIRKKGPH